MNKKIIKIILLLLIIFIPVYKVEAKTLRQYQNELDKLESDYNANKSKKNLTKSEIDSLNGEISKITSSINANKEEIKVSEQEIIKNQNKIEEKSNETDELLKFLQVSSGENAYLEYIFEADSYTDFIYRYSVVSQLTEYNNNLMEELKRLNNELEQKKKELAQKQSELEKKSSELNSKMITLRANLTTIEKDGSTIEEDIRDSRKLIEYYKSIGCSLDQDVSSCVSVQYSSGWRYPISHGYVTSNYTGFAIRNDWSGGGGHHGIDLAFNGIYGEPVYAAAAGEVGTASWISGGGNAVYIYHNVNGIKYTSVYMHMTSFGPGIRSGAKVTSDTIVGYAGNTGGNYGAHLHFGLAYGWRFPGQDFNNNSFNPREKFNFPDCLDDNPNAGQFYRK